MTKQDIIAIVTALLAELPDTVPGPLVFQVKLVDFLGGTTCKECWREYPRPDEPLPPPSPQAIVDIIREHKRAMVQQQRDLFAASYEKLIEGPSDPTHGFLSPPTPDGTQRMLAWYKFTKPLLLRDGLQVSVVGPPPERLAYTEITKELRDSSHKAMPLPPPQDRPYHVLPFGFVDRPRAVTSEEKANWFVSGPDDPSNYTLADDDEVKPDHVVPR